MDAKEKLAGLVTQLYQECGQTVKPMYPRVLVRLLPREQKVGSILLPGYKQNKPTHEGVVLAVYQPFVKRERVISEDGTTIHDEYDVECEVEVGDHILFPHTEFGITPVWPLDDGDGDYRLVPEQHILARLDYARGKKTELHAYPEMVSKTLSGA